MVACPGSFGALLKDEKACIHRSMVFMRDTVMMRGGLVKCVSWYAALARSLPARTVLSMMGTCSPLAHICKVTVRKGYS